MAGTPYKQLSRGVTSGSYYEKLVIVFRMTAHVAFGKSLYTSAILITSHAASFVKTVLPVSDRMNVPNVDLADCRHAVALLKGLNLQREFGQFCDCVIKLHVNPGRLFLAHKSVLAASSPVFASLLTSRGALLDLHFPSLSPETMDYLLDYIYTGKLPPKNQEDSVMSVAVDLQMEELQHALVLERHASLESPNIQGQIDRRRISAEQQHEEGNCVSPTYPSSFKRPSPSCLGSEAVPVIQHAGAYGKSSPVLQQASKPRCNVNIAEKKTASADRRLSDETQWSDRPASESKLEDLKRTIKTDDELLGPSTKKAKVSPDHSPAEIASHYRCQRSVELADELLDSGSQAVVETSVRVSPKTVCVSTHIKQARHKDVSLSPGGSKDHNLSDATRVNDSHVDTHVTKVSEHDDGASDGFMHSGCDPIIPRTFMQFPGTSLSIPGSGPHCLDRGHYEDGCGDISYRLQSEADTQCAVHVAVSRKLYKPPSGVDTSETLADSKSCFKSVGVGPLNSDKSDCSVNMDVAFGVRTLPGGNSSSMSERSNSDQEDSCDMFSQRSSGGHTYQAQVRYHCLTQEPRHNSASSDSDVEGHHSNPARTPHFPHTLTSRAALVPTPSMEPLQTASGGSRAPLTSSSSLAAQQQQQQPYQCTMCDRAFSQRGSLNRHMRSHLGVRPYSCPQCPMTFSRQYRVTEHMRVHQRGCEDLQKAGPT